jgi:competence protein ComGC
MTRETKRVILTIVEMLIIIGVIAVVALTGK